MATFKLLATGVALALVPSIDELLVQHGIITKWTQEEEEGYEVATQNGKGPITKTKTQWTDEQDKELMENCNKAISIDDRKLIFGRFAIKHQKTVCAVSARYYRKRPIPAG